MSDLSTDEARTAVSSFLLVRVDCCHEESWRSGACLWICVHQPSALVHLNVAFKVARKHGCKQSPPDFCAQPSSFLRRVHVIHSVYGPFLGASSRVPQVPKCALGRDQDYTQQSGRPHCRPKFIASMETPPCFQPSDTVCATGNVEGFV